jgi:glycosyltransferase involved in cell wall biosynthesis
MRIVHFYPRAAAGDGGITNSVKYLSDAMVKHGAELVIAFEGGNAHIQDGVRWVPIRLAGPRGLKFPVGLAEILDGADLMVLHSAWVFHNIAAAKVARRAGVPYVLAPRGAYDPHIVARRRFIKAAWLATMERRLLRRSVAVHIFFESERAHLNALGYDGPVIVAPNGVEPPADVTWDGGSGGYVLWLGRFDPEHKGLDLLIEGIAKLPRESRPQLHLHGPDWRGQKSGVRELVRSRGLDPWITVDGSLHGADKWEAFARATGFVYPSRWEGFGNSVAEAISIGLPTLVTPYPFGRELALRSGALLTEASSEGLADGLKRLSGPEARAVGRSGAEFARGHLSWDVVARSWLRQAEGVL